MVEMAPGILRGDLTRRIESLLISGPAKRPGLTRAGALAASTMAVALLLTPPAIRFGQTPGLVPAASPDLRPAIAARLDSTIAAYADSGFSGSILVAMGDSIILAEGYGFADREGDVPATADTRYSVAGFTKMFTAAAILTLEHEGRLRVTDSIARFFGPLPGTDGQVTLDQLLTHTDGLTRQNAPVYRVDPRQFVRAVSASPDSFSPGQGYRYNDFGHSVLGVIVEQISGTSYEDFIRDHFIGPAGLSHTGFEIDKGMDYATEYAGPPGNQYRIPPRSYTWGRRGSLGMVSTVGDMYRWVRSLDDSRVIPADVRNRMFQVHGPTDWGAQRGYGWDRIRQRDGSVLWRRVAGTPGMEGEILHDPIRNWTAVILVNSRVEWRFRVWKDIADAVTGIGSRPDSR
jgi:CubicO group peptidase (beta-lactamase class C family)